MMEEIEDDEQYCVIRYDASYYRPVVNLIVEDLRNKKWNAQLVTRGDGEQVIEVNLEEHL